MGLDQAPADRICDRDRSIGASSAKTALPHQLEYLIRDLVAQALSITNFPRQRCMGKSGPGAQLGGDETRPAPTSAVGRLNGLAALVRYEANLSLWNWP
jgi:hypothetical protein